MTVSNFVALINNLFPEPEASLLAGMLFGARRTMPPDFYQALITTGTLHVIALSGFNISIIMRLLYDFCAGVFGRLLGSLLTILGIGGFVLFVGASPTVIRAALMGSLTVLAVLLGRKDIPLLSLFFTGLLMLLWDFKILGNLSFQLSFLATLGIILFGGGAKTRLFGGRFAGAPHSAGSSDPIPQRRGPTASSMAARIKSAVKGLLRDLWSGVRDDFRVTISAQVFTLPVILYNFQRISLISPIANVFTGWLVPPITYFGFVVVFLAWVWRPLGRISSLGLWLLLKIFVVLVGFFAHFPLATLQF